ncbi:MAG: nucleotide-binding protein [Gammaproteobacteria bacterium]|nr:nucleotide-binding protein [Gammaproteobacteria bacterium]MCF6261583.1 nucleotide-binding protein [Gammaproteobacteria bacterium]
MEIENGNRARCFIIQPYGTRETPKGVKVNNDAVYKSLKRLDGIDPSFPIRVYRADTEKFKRENLHSHVSDCIKESNFCIVDVNGQNPNVLYELGYARGSGRKVIILCRDKKEIPGDMEGVIYIEYGEKEIDELPDKVYPHLARVEGEISNTIEIGLEKIPYLPKRNDELIRQKILRAKTKIDILQTNLSILSYEFIGDIVSAMKENNTLELRVLTLDPQSIFVNYRAQQLGYTKVGIFRNELINALENVSFNLREFGSRVRIKTYDDFPAQIAFHIDNDILSCVVSAIGRSRDNCAFLLPDSIAGAQKSFVEHFNKLWNSNESREHDEDNNNSK